MVVILAMPASEVIDEAAALRSAWHNLYGTVPSTVNVALEQDRYLEAAIELARTILGEDGFVGWRASFTSAGAPYDVKIFLGAGFSQKTLDGQSSTALSAAFIDAIAAYQEIRRHRQ
jgi:hypothetical protein